MRRDSVSDAVNLSVSALGWTSTGFSLGLLYTGTSTAAAIVGTVLGTILGASYMAKTVRGDT